MKKQTLDFLREDIESQLNWGEVDDWSTYDFEKLSSDIQQATDVSLSVSTLKRFFGKVKYQNKPSFTTLNALSAFLGYEDWRSFEVTSIAKTVQEPRVSPTSLKKSFQIKPYLYSCVVLLLASLVFFYQKTKSKYNPDDFKFSSKTMVSKGLPNSVVFDYDASKVHEGDSVFICQNWDVSRKTEVDRSSTHHSSIYYYPGYFRAKLMAGDYVLKEHDIQILTNGWAGFLAPKGADIPLYFTREDIYSDGEVGASEELLAKYNATMTSELPQIWFSNQKDLNGFKTDNFEFEIDVRSDFFAGKAACQKVEVLLQAKDDILIVPLSQPSCVGDLYLAAYGFGVNSRSADLSGFGTDLKEWVKLRVVCKGGHLEFLVNEKLAYKADTQNPVNEIVGVHVRFEGPGALRNATLKSGEQVCVFD